MEGTEGATPVKELRPTIIVRQFPNIDHVPGDTANPAIWEFAQSELSFFEKNELTRILAGALDFALQSGVGLMDILASFQEGAEGRNVVDQLRSGSLVDTTSPATSSIVGVVLRLVSAVPDLLVDTYLLALKVPPRQRDGVRSSLMRIDDELGFEIFDVFVDQNAEALRRFFERWWKSLVVASKTLGVDGSMEKAVSKSKARRTKKA